MTTTRVYIDSTVTASRSLGQIAFPISTLPDLVPGMILQWDVDGTAGSLARNRVGADMTVVGSPAIASYAASLNETAYIDTGISIAPYANSDMTFIGITNNPGGKFNVVGVMQVAAPKRSRCHEFETTHKPGGLWLNSAGASWFSVLDSAPAEAAAPDGIFSVSRTVTNDGTGRVGIHADLPITGQHALVTNGTAPSPSITGNIYIGASLDHGTTVTGQVMAVLAFSRAITDTEMATIYRAYKSYYAGLGKSI
ncbi:hypothetical protein [Klebsiella aerogenes]|uniref:hypothetical protein n=1 Tax=Klebsiella aerogenes TaxID=548 RepID=UPI000666327D|nr:hypothetical protein [Klebsiella aerogenes]